MVLKTGEFRSDPADESRLITGFFSQLSDEQKEHVLSYEGEENHGDPSFRLEPHSLRDEIRSLRSELLDTRISLIHAERDREINAIWRDCYKEQAGIWGVEAVDHRKTINRLAGIAAIGWVMFVGVVIVWCVS
jgi:hypothetical protein